MITSNVPISKEAKVRYGRKMTLAPLSIGWLRSAPLRDTLKSIPYRLVDVFFWLSPKKAY